MSLVYCCVCKQLFELTESDVLYKGRWYHKSCFNQQQNNSLKAPIGFDIESSTSTPSKRQTTGTVQDKSLKQIFLQLVEELLGAGNIDYGKVTQQINSFHKKGITFADMTNALNYFYRVKGNSPANSKRGIGIVPWVYEEANRYFQEQEQAKEEALKKINQGEVVLQNIQTIGTEKVIQLNPQLMHEPRNTRKQIDLTQLNEE